MIQENQGQYLLFKNIQNPKVQKDKSQMVSIKRNIYISNQNATRDREKGRPNEKSHQKQTITSKAKLLLQSSPKSAKFNCEVISFSTASTKKQTKQINRNITSFDEKNQNLNTQSIDLNGKQRLTKAKSVVHYLKGWEKCRTEQKIKKQLIEEVMEEIPLKYQLDFKNYQNQPNQDEHLSLIHTIKVYQAKIERLQKEIELKNSKIKMLQKDNSHKFMPQRSAQSYIKPQNKYLHEENRHNVRRLLKMLQMTEQYKQFAKFGLDDDGVAFLAEANITNKAMIDILNEKMDSKKVKSHYCSCSKQFVPQSYLWVSQSIYEFGKQFIKQKQNQDGFLSKSEYELLLYQLNKMWRQRQKRIINTIRHQKNLEIQKLKRKFSVNQNNRVTSARKDSKY